MTPQALQLSRHARRVYVGSLPPGISEVALTHYFNQVGELAAWAGLICARLVNGTHGTADDMQAVLPRTAALPGC